MLNQLKTLTVLLSGVAAVGLLTSAPLGAQEGGIITLGAAVSLDR